MTDKPRYQPGPAAGATIDKSGADWALVMEREFRHSPDKVWQALTDPAELQQWAPFDANGNLGVAGASVELTTVGAPSLRPSATTVTRADRPRVLEYNWGHFEMRWKLEPAGKGTRLTLWTNIDRRFIAMGAAGWHLCFDVLDHLLDGAPLGRVVGPDAMQFDGWHKLHAEYAAKFGVEMPNWSSKGK